MEKINLVELLKDCPKGMELDCTMFDNVTFARVDYSRKQFPIEITVSGLHSKYLTKEGCFHDTTLLPEAKCVIYPKGKTTWEGFQRPFKNGDIIYIKCKYYDWCSIFYKCEDEKLYTYVDFCITSNNFYCSKPNIVCECSDIIEHRFATEEEKQKLFDAMKDNGYQWNAETKTLEKLVEPKLVKPKFKDGDWITNGEYTWKVISVDYLDYTLQNQCGECVEDTVDYVNKTFRLWIIQDAKDGDVLAFNDETIVIFKDLYNSTSFHSYCYIECGIFDFNKDELPDWWEAEGFKPATKEQSDILFQKMKEAGYEWALNQSDEIKNLIENNGYDKGFQDAIEKAKTIIINFMPLPSNKNHNINQDIDLLEERQKYAHQVAKKFEEMMNTDER